jgi:hypothetical protein
VCGLVYRKYSHVAATMNPPTGIAKVIMEPASVQSLPSVIAA